MKAWTASQVTAELPTYLHVAVCVFVCVRALGLSVWTCISVCEHSACVCARLCLRHHLCCHVQLRSLGAQDPKLSCYQDNPHTSHTWSTHRHTDTHPQHFKITLRSYTVCAFKWTDGLRWIIPQKVCVRVSKRETETRSDKQMGSLCFSSGWLSLLLENVRHVWCEADLSLC